MMKTLGAAMTFVVLPAAVVTFVRRSTHRL